jgi:formylmethanofuran dehydrogenase subunit E
MDEKIKLECSKCGKSFSTTQEFADKKYKDGKPVCGKCRRAAFPKKEKKEKE